MGISFSNIGTVGREQLITSGSNGEPNWSYIPSKGKSTKKAKVKFANLSSLLIYLFIYQFY